MRTATLTKIATYSGEDSNPGSHPLPDQAPPLELEKLGTGTSRVVDPHPTLHPQSRILYLKRKGIAPFAEACLTLSPRLFVHGGEELFIDLTPTLKWFGGEEAWLTAFEKLRESFNERTPYLVGDRMEWSKAFYERDSEALLEKALVIPPGQSQSWLWQLPIERLMAVGDPTLLAAERKDREYLVSFMRRVGLNRICDFVRLDATAIGRRFGKRGLILQDWLLGHRPIAFPPFVSREPLKEFIDAEDLISVQALLHQARGAFDRIAARLVGRGEMAKVIQVSFYFDEQATQHQFLTFHEPARTTAALIKPLEQYLDRPRWEGPLKFIELEVKETGRFVPGQLSLFETTENRMADLAGYVQELQGRWGEEAVGFAELQESYVPERSWRRVFPPPVAADHRPWVGMRPPILYSPPRPYTPPRHFSLTPSENLATEWWEDSGAYRRYFIAHHPHGPKLWLFWDCQKREWFLQGSFD